MSVLIKGMEMPERCWDCGLCYDSFYCIALEVQFSDREDFEPGERRLSDCPLIPVPPHGRLKKRLVYRGEVYNALEAERVKSLDGILTDPYKDGFHDGLKRALQILANEADDAPTIIPAEEGET